MTKEKAYLSGRLRCAALLKIELYVPLNCMVILMNLFSMLLVDPLIGDKNIWSSVNETSEGIDSATLSEKRALREHLVYLIRT